MNTTLLLGIVNDMHLEELRREVAHDRLVRVVRQQNDRRAVRRAIGGGLIRIGVWIAGRTAAERDSMPAPMVTR